MDTEKDGARRDAFLWKVAAQFEDVAGSIGAGFDAHVWNGFREAVLSVGCKGEDGELLRVRAFFDDEGAHLRGWDEKLSLVLDWKGDWDAEPTDRLVLGWSGSLPDFEAGLDSRADYVGHGSAYAVGKVVQALGQDVRALLTPHLTPLSHSLALRSRREPGPVIEAASESVKPVARAKRKPAAQEARGQAPVAPEKDNIRLLTTSLGALTEAKVLSAEAVFAEFIETARLTSLRQRQVISFVQSALLDLYLVEKEFFEGPSWKRPSGVRVKGGALMEAVSRTKASMFRRGRSAQEHQADKIVAGMEGYYRVVVSQSGRLNPDEVNETVNRAFGKTKVIVTEAVNRFRSSVWPNWARLEQLFQRRSGLE